MAKNPAQARTMTPKKAAEFLRENFSREEQLAELKAMMTAGGRVTTLAHGIAVELRLIEHEDLEEVATQNLISKSVDLGGGGYGAPTLKNANERSEFAGKGPMFARMGSEEISVSESRPTEPTPTVQHAEKDED